MRASELLSLRFTDIYQSVHPFLEIKGKRDRWRRIPLSKKAVNLIKKLETLLSLEKFDSPYICFNLSNTDKHISYETLRLITEKTAKNITNLKTTPHWFRRTYITKMLAEGVALYTVMKFSGHESIATTNKYLQDQKREHESPIPFE